MLIHLLFGKSVRRAAKGQVRKLVHCEVCGCDFVYIMNRVGVGSSFNLLHLEGKRAAARAEKDAANRLRGLLATGFDSIPCPDCGNYQAQMVAALKKKKWYWIRLIGTVGTLMHFLLIAPCFLTDGRDFWGALVASFALPTGYMPTVSIPLLAIGWYLRIRYRPNAKAAERAGLVEPGPNGPFRCNPHPAAEMAEKSELARRADFVRPDRP